VNNKELWEALQEYLQKAKTLELQVLVGATSELEVYRSQGRVSSLARMEQLKNQVKDILSNRE
jgi:hypothetical protein